MEIQSPQACGCISSCQWWTGDLCTVASTLRHPKLAVKLTETERFPADNQFLLDMLMLHDALGSLCCQVLCSCSSGSKWAPHTFILMLYLSIFCALCSLCVIVQGVHPHQECSAFKQLLGPWVAPALTLLYCCFYLMHGGFSDKREERLKQSRKLEENVESCNVEKAGTFPDSEWGKGVQYKRQDGWRNGRHVERWWAACLGDIKVEQRSPEDIYARS